MLKALLKKQFFSMFGSKKGKPGVRGYLLLIAAVALMGGFMCYGIFDLLCAPLAGVGLDWLYFVYAGLTAIVLAVVGGIFMAQSQLYEAKDNDFLLSMPVPPRYILFVRMVMLYLQNFLLDAVVLVPAFIVYIVAVGVTAGQVFIWLAMLLLQPLLSLFFTCLLGFLVALITARMRDKTLVTMIFSILFLVVYLIVYMQFMNYVTALIQNSAAIGEGIKSYFYPLYKFGTACTGDFVGLVITFVLIGVLFGGLYFLLSKTYIRLVTGKRSAARAKYKGKPERVRSPFASLLKKETRRFFGSGIYFLNCGLGVIIFLIGTALFIAKGNALIETLSAVEGLKEALPLLVVLLIAFISAMDAVSAPSISLEGKALWLLQSTPVSLWQALKAKLTLHYLVTAPAATLCTVVFAVFLKPTWVMIVLMLLAPSVVVTLFGVLGLIFNLKKPNLNWDNETFVIKQSLSVLLTMVTSWGIFAVFAGLYFAVRSVMAPEIYLLICLLLLCAGAAGGLVFLKKRGVKMLEEL